MTRRAFTLIELLVVVAIIGLLAAILFPVFASARERGRQTACTSNLKQIGMAFALYTTDNDNTLPDRRDLKTSLGYRTWTPATAWPPSDPRGGWAALVLLPYLNDGRVWSCPSVEGTALGAAGEVAQTANTTTTRYWLWRFDRMDDPVPLTDGWGKTEAQLVTDLDTANDPTVNPRQPEGPADVELAVDPYFPSNIATVDPALKGRAVHFGGRNRAFLDGHVKWLRDIRTQ